MEVKPYNIRTTVISAGALATELVAGLIAVAAVNEMVIAHPLEHTSAALSLLLYGGPILHLVAQGWYLWAVPRVSPRPHLAGSAALVLAGFATLSAPSYVALILVAASLTTMTILDRPDDRTKRESIGGNQENGDQNKWLRAFRQRTG